MTRNNTQMTQQKQAIQLFEERKVRTVWDDRTEEWYFSVLDVISVLTDSVNPTDYFKKMRKRDGELAVFVGTNCPQVAMVSESGVKRKTLAGDMKSILRIIQSIPSPKAEPFKQWMALVAADRLDQMQDPELSIQQAMADYKRLGYSDNWINQQLKAIETKISDLEKKMQDLPEDSAAYQELSLQMEGAKKADSYIRENIQKKFENQITKYQKYRDDNDLAITNNATRGSRLDLITERLSSQKATFKELQTDNEGIDITQVAVELSSAELTYQAALMATGKIMQTNLMNYI